MLITWFQSKLKCQKKINLTLKMNLDIYFGWFGWEKKKLFHMIKWNKNLCKWKNLNNSYWQ